MQRLSKKLRKSFYERKVKDLRTSDPHNWWRNVKRFVGLSGGGSLNSIADELCNGDVTQLANDVNLFFASVASDLPALKTDFCVNFVDDYCSDFIIEPFEVERKLSGICVRKSPGPDCLPNWFLKDMAPVIAEPLCAIFNASVRQGVVPAIWKRADVIPIPKVRPPRSIENDLRPISLTPTVAKVLESFVGGWIMKKIEHRLDGNQFGALRGRSTSHALVAIIHKWCCALDAGNSVRTLFVDFSKAFDRVDHTLLLNKLLAYGTPNALVKWLFSFLKDREQRVKIGQSLSHWCKLAAGFPQGTWMGPLAFVAIIDDLQPSCSVHKFIDDTTLTEILVDNSSHMDRFAGELELWSSNNYMVINYKKTKELILGNLKKHTVIPPLIIGGHPIERVSCFKLLGVTITDDLRWEVHIESISSKVNSRLYFLKQLKRAGLSTDDLRCFYTTVVRPVLEYACVVWHHGLTRAQCDQLEALQKRAIRIIYGPIVVSMPYNSALYFSNLDALGYRRASIGKSFFKEIIQPTSCLHHLLPPRRDPLLFAKLRHPKEYEVPRLRTARYCSSIHYGLVHYQK